MYLGYIIDCRHSNEANVALRSKMARAAFYKVPQQLWTNQCIPMNVRGNLYRSLVLSIITYGCATWTLLPRETTHLESVYHRHLRVITERHVHTTSTPTKQPDGTTMDVLQFHYPQPALLRQLTDLPAIQDIVRSARLQLAGEIIRCNDSSPLSWLIEGDQQQALRGGTPTDWWAIVLEDMRTLNLTIEDATSPSLWKTKTKARRPSRTPRPPSPPAKP